MTTTDDRAVRAVVVLGGDRADRSRAVAELVQGATSRRGRTEPDRVLVLTCGHDELDPRTGTSADGRVELRRLEPTRLVGAYLAGASDPQDEVLAALATGTDAPLARTLLLEYARRAVASAFWATVVIDLDGGETAPRVLAAPDRLLAFVDRLWPAHRRFAAMAAGDRAEMRIRVAHQLAELSTGVRDFLAGVELVGAGEHPGRMTALAELARGGAPAALSGDHRDGYVLEVAVPVPLADEPHVEGQHLVLIVEALEVRVELPAVLRRCLLVDTECPTVAGETLVRAHFRPDPEQWPPHLTPDETVGASR